MPVLVVTFTPEPGRVDEVQDIIAGIAPQVHEEPGCEVYALHRSGDKLVLIEKWTTMEDLDVHRTAPSLLEIRERLAEPVPQAWDIVFCESVPAGSSPKSHL